MLLKKDQAAQVGAYDWENDGDTVDVDDDFAAELLAIPGGDFTVAEPDPEPEPKVTKAAAAKAAKADAASDEAAAGTVVAGTPAADAAVASAPDTPAGK